MDRTSVIFGNPQPEKTIRKAEKGKQKFLRRFGDDSGADYRFSFVPIDALGEMGVQNMVLGREAAPFPQNGVVVGNIRMGFGHYRISIAMASCARAMGYEPLWLDLAAFDATGSKMIRAQNDLYSLGSRISQKSRLFNALVWEPMNSEGFRKLSYNACDQKNSELLAPLFRNLPKEIPYIATHVWPAQGAIHGGLTHVVNAIPDNWPMALHLAEGAVHTVQTPFAYLGYKKLNGFDTRPLRGMDEKDIKLVGAYIDHELVANLEADNAARKARCEKGEPLRILLTVGGAGAGQDMFAAMLRHLLPYVKRGQVTLYLNFGDHRKVYDSLCGCVKEFRELSVPLFNEYGKVQALANSDSPEGGIYAICNENLFEAVYSTNLLMRRSDLLVTKPSELAFYPIPKLFMRHIGGHEVYGARYSAELGDGTFECPTEKSICDMLDYLISDRQMIASMCGRIDALKAAGCYNGAYECVKLAANRE